MINVSIYSTGQPCVLRAVNYWKVSSFSAVCRKETSERIHGRQLLWFPKQATLAWRAENRYPTETRPKNV